MSEKEKPGPSSVVLGQGDVAPDFTVSNSSNESVSLGDLLGGEGGSEGTILFFYPRASTPGCTKEACDFRDCLIPLDQAGFRVVGISPDTPAANSRFAEKYGFSYPLLSDPDLTVLQAYGVWGEKNLYGKHVVGVKRSTFVISPDRTIRLALYNVRATGHVASLSKKLGLV